MSKKELIESRAAKFAEAQTYINKKDATAEDKSKFDALMSEVDAIGADLARSERAEKMETELRAIKTPSEQGVNNTENRSAEQIAAERIATEKRAMYQFVTGKTVGAEERKSFGFSQAANGGAIMETRTEDPGLTTGTGSAGYLIPPYFQRDLEVRMKYYCPFLEFADVVETADGAPMTWPVMDDTGNVAVIVAEGDTVQDVDLGVSRQTFGAFKYGTLVKVSQEISQDSFTNIDGLVTDAFANRFGRGLTADFTLGNGSTAPQGIVTGAMSGGTVAGDDNQTSPNPLTQVGYLDLLGLLHSVDIAYRNNPKAAFMLNDNTLKAIRSLKDKFGRPLWQPGIAQGEPDTILGKPYHINNSVADIGASAKPVLFGDMSRFKVRRVRNLFIQRLVERYADAGMVGLIGWARYDSKVLNAGGNPIKYLVCPSS